MANEKILEALNDLLEHEYAGVLRYSHYSLMVYGYNRIPIVGWLREQAKESLTHAEQIGEHITTLGGHPSLVVAKLLETHKHSIADILTESLEHEKAQISKLHAALKLVEGSDIYLEEFIRDMIVSESDHVSEIEKMIRGKT